MKIFYPYNEVLPNKKAHDAYIVRQCASLAENGHDVTLICGKGSMQRDELLAFYDIDKKNPLKLVCLPILRGKNILHFKWNFVFFYLVQKYIQQHSPDLVLLSVIKQARFHLSRKVKGVKYIYELHQLSWYPSLKNKFNLKKILIERFVFNHSSMVLSTTDALKEILKVYPYKIMTNVQKVPLACDFKKLESKKENTDNFKLAYIGQLYHSQGISFLLEALKEVEHLFLKIIGGRGDEISYLRQICLEYNIVGRVEFVGFIETKEIPKHLTDVDAFITTFENIERMPYVAHTKLIEYKSFSKPIVAPDLPVVKEHLKCGTLFYTPGSQSSLIETLTQLMTEETYRKLCSEVEENEIFSWEDRALALNKIFNEKFLVNN